MSMPYEASECSPDEIEANRRRCWWTGCKNRAWLDSMGWHWCLTHWWNSDVMQGETWGHRWVTLKYTQIRF